ncbi:MAG: hypothetical protein H7Z38_15580 [Rubrivivax sp.]|nr:hypothetical protein [Pyrinomonadaceae bacterium]
MQRFSTTILALALLLVPVLAQQPVTPSAQTPARQGEAATQTPPKPLPPPRVKIEDYRERASRIIGAALTSDTAYRRLAWLTDRIGHRLSGSESLERAVEWAVAEMKRDRLDNVRAEKVMVPHWVRGAESLELVSPVRKSLPMLALGNSVGTPPEGLTAEAVVVRSFDELEALVEARARDRGHVRGGGGPCCSSRQAAAGRDAATLIADSRPTPASRAPLPRWPADPVGVYRRFTTTKGWGDRRTVRRVSNKIQAWGTR